MLYVRLEPLSMSLANSQWSMYHKSDTLINDLLYYPVVNIGLSSQHRQIWSLDIPVSDTYWPIVTSCKVVKYRSYSDSLEVN